MCLGSGTIAGECTAVAVPNSCSKLQHNALLVPPFASEPKMNPRPYALSAGPSALQNHDRCVLSVTLFVAKISGVGMDSVFLAVFEVSALPSWVIKPRRANPLAQLFGTASQGKRWTAHPLLL